MNKDREKLEKIYQQLNEEGDIVLKKMVLITYTLGDIIIPFSCF